MVLEDLIEMLFRNISVPGPLLLVIIKLLQMELFSQRLGFLYLHDCESISVRFSFYSAICLFVFSIFETSILALQWRFCHRARVVSTSTFVAFDAANLVNTN